MGGTGTAAFGQGPLTLQFSSARQKIQPQQPSSIEQSSS